MNWWVCIGLAALLTGCGNPLAKPDDTALSVAKTEVADTMDEQKTPADSPPEQAAETIPEPTAEPTPEPTEKPAPLEGIESPYSQNFGDPRPGGVLSNKKVSWYFMKNENHQPTVGPRDMDIREFDGCYLGDIYAKEFYLTFDAGYENGYTPIILDILKEKNVPAAFFSTKSYLEGNHELIQRMVDEGHLVVNHSDTHPSIPDVSDEQVRQEILETARYFQEITGQEMPKFFRPPMGEYSARTMALTQEVGYKTVFWSFAYMDWLVDEQPGRDHAYKVVIDNLHPGEIILLHAVSSSNTEALADIIDEIRAQGYTFKSLYELP